jgi:hypothetical protein
MDEDQARARRVDEAFPGRGQIEVHAGAGLLNSSEGRYGVLKAIYEYELREHQRAQARARDVWERIVRADRLMWRASDAAWVALDEVRAFGACLQRGGSCRAQRGSRQGAEGAGRGD